MRLGWQEVVVGDDLLLAFSIIVNFDIGFGHQRRGSEADILEQGYGWLAIELNLPDEIVDVAPRISTEARLNEVKVSIFVLDKQVSVRLRQQCDLMVDAKPLLDRSEVVRELVKLV